MRLLERFKKARENKKGFTLVELIVVIVILGILAAILVPSFIGYMNKANNSQAQIQARSLYLAGKTIAAEEKYDLPKTEIKNTDEDTGNKAKLTELAPDTDQIQSYTVTILGEKVNVTCTTKRDVVIKIGDTIS
ncbi:MAG: type II secretion system protein [Lachnospiraceae bacterium]|jgi:prepilin-type N-terminal cleavage/methylation domain-containing protein|nr:type II secretion system protein [Lachnospiraceae bacterium]